MRASCGIVGFVERIRKLVPVPGRLALGADTSAGSVVEWTRGSTDSLDLGTRCIPKRMCIVGKKLYVGNLAYRTTEDQLRDLFGQAGTVLDVYLPMDRETGRVRGFGFVEMSSDSEAAEAIRLCDGYSLDNRQIRVNEAQARQGAPEGAKGRPRGPRY